MNTFIRHYYLLSILLFASLAFAQTPTAPVLSDIGIDQKLGAQVPADLVFRDEVGKQVRLADYFGNRPIVLTLVYYRCPMLCTLVLNDLTRTLNELPASASVGDRFDIITVSFDPRETPDLAAAKKRQYLNAYRRPAAETGWHFLTGDEASIRKLTESVGFRYAYDAKADQYAHASGIMVLTPQGKISRYFYGIDYRANDLRLSIAEASAGAVSSTPTEQILLYCFHYDPSTGKYSLAVTRLVRAAAVLTLATLGTFWFVMYRRDRRAKSQETSAVKMP